MKMRFAPLAWGLVAASTWGALGTARAQDSAQDEAQDSAVASATASAVAPQITVDAPRAGGIYLAAQLSGGLIQGRVRSASNSGGVSVDALVLSRQVGTVVRYYDGRTFSLVSGKYLTASLTPGAGGGVQTWSLRLPTIAQGLIPGSYRLSVIARDRSGGSAFVAPITFTVRAPAPPVPIGDHTAPTVSIDIPSNGGVYSATQTHFGAIGSARDVGGSGVASVRVIAYRYADASGPAGYFNGSTFLSRTPIEVAAVVAGTGPGPGFSAQWLFDWPAVKTAGRILVTAIARDRAGNRSQASITFTRR